MKKASFFLILLFSLAESTTYAQSYPTYPSDPRDFDCSFSARDARASAISDAYRAEIEKCSSDHEAANNACKASHPIGQYCDILGYCGLPGSYESCILGAINTFNQCMQNARSHLTWARDYELSLCKESLDLINRDFDNLSSDIANP